MPLPSSTAPACGDTAYRPATKAPRLRGGDAASQAGVDPSRPSTSGIRTPRMPGVRPSGDRAGASTSSERRSGTRRWHVGTRDDLRCPGARLSRRPDRLGDIRLDVDRPDDAGSSHSPASARRSGSRRGCSGTRRGNPVTPGVAIARQPVIAKAQTDPTGGGGHRPSATDPTAVRPRSLPRRSCALASLGSRRDP